MMPTLAPPSVLSAPQRRCQILLTLFQPGLTATMATFSELNGVDDDIASLDITHPPSPFRRYSEILPHCFTFFRHSPTIFPRLMDDKEVARKGYGLSLIHI